MADPAIADPDYRPASMPKRDDQESEANDNADLFVQFKEWYRQDRDHSSEWRTEARHAYDFVAGKQWSQEDEAKLQEALRVPVTFNRIGPIINIVAGLETGNRQETRYIPRLPGAAGVNDLLTGASKFFRDECDAEDEESDAFRDSVICGMGWCDTNLSYADDPNGMMVIERIDPIEMFWDAGGVKKNLADARRLWRVKDISVDEAQALFPGADP